MVRYCVTDENCVDNKFYKTNMENFAIFLFDVLLKRKNQNYRNIRLWEINPKYYKITFNNPGYVTGEYVLVKCDDDYEVNEIRKLGDD